MDNSGFEFSLVKVFVVADGVAKNRNLKFISDLMCFVALLLCKESSLYSTLIKKGITDEQIHEAVTKMFNKYKISVEDQKDSMKLDFNLINTTYYVSYELNEIIQYAFAIAKNFYNKETIGPDELLASFSEYLEEEYTFFINQFTLKNEKPLDSVFSKEENDMVIPHELVGCLTILNHEEFANTPKCLFLGREEETKKMLNILAKHTKRNCILVGEPGVGKTALVEKLAWMIATGNCPEKFKDYVVVSLDINSIIAGTQFRGQAEERFAFLIEFLNENPKCILYIDEIHTLLGAGACREGEMDLANAMKPILARGNVQVVGSTTKEEYERFFSKDGALKRRFEKIFVKEPKSYEIYDMIKNQIDMLSKEHNTSITREFVNKIIFYASCFSYETKNPDRTLDLIDKSMAVAELAGHKEVTIEDIQENFDTNKKLFLKTSKPIIVSLAYHEAGHYILHRFSPELSNLKVLAVSIMPADDYLGVNVLEPDDEVIPSNTLDYYIQLVGCKLAGRVAEKMYSEKLSAGASNDLLHATAIIKNVIMNYGLDEEFSTNRVFEEKFMFSGKMSDLISGRIDSLLKQAEDYALNVLTEHREELDKLVAALIENGMLSNSEIDEILK